jgi:hypothetical protein
MTSVLESNAPDDMLCTICNLNLLRPNSEPVRTSLCEHMFCKKCLKRWHQRVETSLSERDLDDEYEDTSSIGGCPICRSGASQSVEEHQRKNKIMPLHIHYFERYSIIRCVQQTCTSSLTDINTFLFPCGHCICNHCQTDIHINHPCPTCTTRIEKFIAIPPDIINYFNIEIQNNEQNNTNRIHNNLPLPRLTPQTSLPQLNSNSYLPQSPQPSQPPQTPHHPQPPQTPHHPQPPQTPHHPQPPQTPHHPQPPQTPQYPQPPQYLSIEQLYNNNYSTQSILQHLSQKYYEIPVYTALNIFLCSDGDIFTFYTENSSILPDNKNQWTAKQKILWNILMDILSKICTDQNTSIQSFYLFNLTPKLLTLSISIYQRVKTILNTRRIYNIQYPYYNVILGQNEFQWRMRVTDIDNVLPWIPLNNVHHITPNTRVYPNNNINNNINNGVSSNPISNNQNENENEHVLPIIQPLLTQKLFEILVINANSEMLYSISSLIEKQWKMLTDLRAEMIHPRSAHLYRNDNSNNEQNEQHNNSEYIGEYSEENDEDNVYEDNNEDNIEDNDAHDEDYEDTKYSEEDERREYSEEDENLSLNERDAYSEEDEIQQEEYHNLENDELIAATELTLLATITSYGK